MTWKVLFTASAGRQLRKLDPQIRNRVRRALTKLPTEPDRGKPLQLTLRGLRSWRTGDFRIVYRLVEDRVEVIVLAPGHRRNVYDRLRDRLR